MMTFYSNDILESLDNYIEFYEESHSQMMDVAFLRKLKDHILILEDELREFNNDLQAQSRHIKYLEQEISEYAECQPPI